jgi:DNA-binding response OmpR family regulator
MMELVVLAEIITIHIKQSGLFDKNIQDSQLIKELVVSYILLVEDNQQNADMAIHILTTAGYKVHHFARGVQGAKAARLNRPSVILLDFNLPDIDGRALILSLRQQLGGVAAPPIIAVTARSGTSEESIAKRFGCSAFLSKPYAPEALLALVGRYLPL